MYQNDGAFGGERGESGSDRIAPVLSSGYKREPSSRASRRCGELSKELGWLGYVSGREYEYHMHDIRVRGKRAQRPEHHWNTSDRTVLLGKILAAKSRAAPRRYHHRADVTRQAHPPTG
jgi:hypothetical protein